MAIRPSEVLAEQWARLRGGSFARNVAILAGGTALGQVVIVAASPILTRVYEPADFGVLGFYLGVAGIFSVLANLRFHEAVPLPTDDDEAAPLVGLGIASSIATAALALVAVLALRHWVAEIAEAPDLATALLILPLSVLIYGTNLTLQGWMVRVSDYPALAKVSVRQAVVQIVTQTLLGLTRLAPTGLVVGHAGGNGAGMITFLSRARAAGLRVRVACRVEAMGALARRYRRFPLMRGPTTLLQTISFSGVPVTLTLLYGTTTAGLYDLVVRLLGLPLLLVGQSTMRVFYGEASRFVRTGEGTLGPLYDRTFRSVLTLTAPAVGLGAVASIWVIPVAFGDNWEPSVRFLQIMAPAYVLRIAQSTVGGTFSILGQQRLELILEVVRMAGTAAALATGWVFDLTPIQTISLVSIAAAAGHALVTFMGRRAAVSFDRDGLGEPTGIG